MRETPESVLAGLPGWEEARIEELEGGYSNRTWLVEGGAGKAVLKIDAQPRGAPFNTREAEARIQSAAAEQGLANRVLLATETVYMTEYLEGDIWTRADFDDEAKLAQLAGALRGLHALPLTGRAFDLQQAARQYAGLITDADPRLVSENLRVIEEAPPPRQLACCHNDLVAENILATPEIRFLDWEYACDNDPLFDLATIVAHHDLSTPQAGLLMEHYFNGGGAGRRKDIVAYERLYIAILWLWQAARH